MKKRGAKEIYKGSEEKRSEREMKKRGVREMKKRGVREMKKE